MRRVSKPIVIAVVYIAAVVALVAPAAPPSRRLCSVEGFYDAGAATERPCPGSLPCDPGFYCTGGRRYPCPAGTYGADLELRNSECSGPCPVGFYCPIGIAQPIECDGASLFCPLGSAAPQNVPSGFYSVGLASSRRDRVVECERGFYCVAGNKYPCPAGTYGASIQLASPACTAPCPAGHFCPKGTISPVSCPAGSYGANSGTTSATCSGLCREGFYCPAGSISPTAYPCGTGTYCPRGSASPKLARPGEYVINGNSQVAAQALDCPVGSYCTSADGAAMLCPPGSYGDRRGLATSACSGKCAAGYYCPRGSTSATAVECGVAVVFCPRGSATPTTVSVGSYSIGKVSKRGNDQHTADASTRAAQVKCEPGNYCVKGVRAACPAGTYGSEFGLTSPLCSGPCRAGYYCPLRSIVSTMQQCGASDRYCPEGSATPQFVSKGFCSVGGLDRLTHSAQRLARPGEFAFLGSCYPCPAGTYGTVDGETNPRCSGDCVTGYYCPLGSTSATQKACGGAHVYCPSGAKLPLPVNTGYYTSTDTQQLCPPGKYRDFTTTSSQFIDLATGRSVIAVDYGDALYPLAQCMLCPTGTFKPAHGDDVSLCVACPLLTTISSVDRRTCDCFRLPGGASYDPSIAKLHFNGIACELQSLAYQGDAVSLQAQNSLFTRTAQFPCELGFYCISGVRRPCPGGGYGTSALEAKPQCSGKCAPGFYCPLASTNSTPRACGDASVYCPEASAVPTPVAPGYYTIRSPSRPATHGYVSWNATHNAHIRDAQRQCEVGYYCVLGVKSICPGGRYGDKTGETAPLCAGPCMRGYFCPAGSTSPMQHECGSDQWICRTGSSAPVAVSQGYYSLGFNYRSNTTQFHQQPCEPGFYCVDGIKYQCPAGTFGATSGLASSACSGPCHAGYYCPSYPSAPSASAAQLTCGNSTVFCPNGSGIPQLVGSGNFSVGAGDASGDAKNTTRVAQVRCPKGWYCRGGIRIQCPEGAYGDREGLTSTQCSGWCPAGYFCPPGTADYRSNPCPRGTYAIAGSAFCMPCGVGGINQSAPPPNFYLKSDHELQIPPCVDSRACCFAG